MRAPTSRKSFSQGSSASNNNKFADPANNGPSDSSHGSNNFRDSSFQAGEDGKKFQSSTLLKKGEGKSVQGVDASGISTDMVRMVPPAEKSAATCRKVAAIEVGSTVGKIVTAEVGSEFFGQNVSILPPVSRATLEAEVLGRNGVGPPMVSFLPESKSSPLMAPTLVTNHQLISSSIDESPSIKILLSSRGVTVLILMTK